MASDTELAWTAGMIDADGCITLNKAGQGRRRKPMIAIDNTDHEIIDELSRLYGGSVVKKKKYRDHHRQAWCWRLYGSAQIRTLLVDVYPYMRNAMKRERARILIEEWPALTPRNGIYTVGMLAAKKELEERFMDLGIGRGKRAVAETEGIEPSRPSQTITAFEAG